MVNVELLPEVSSKGNLGLLDEPLAALFCSNRYPSDLILKTCVLARAIRDAGVPVIGGFQTPVEWECPRLLLRGEQPVVVCRARSLDNMRTPETGAQPSTTIACWYFRPSRPQPDALPPSSRHNAMTWWLTSPSEPSSATHHPEAILKAFTGKLVESLKPLLMLDSPANENLVAMGAEVFDPTRSLTELVSHGA